MSEAVPSPFVPTNCDLRDWRMQLDGPRLFQSSFHLGATDSEWRAGVTLWLKSFQQIPAGSLPADPGQLARLAEVDRKKWTRIADAAIRGWTLCSDGRLYHRVVAEVALEAWISRLVARKNSAHGVAKKAKVEFDPQPYDTEIDAAYALLNDVAPGQKSRAKQQRSEANRQKPITTGSTSGETMGETMGDTSGSPTAAPQGQPVLNQGEGEGEGESLSVEPKGSTGAGAVLNGDRPAWWPTRDRYGRTTSEVSEKVLFDVGKVVLGKSAGGQITKMRKAYNFNDRAVLELLLQADDKADPVPWFAAVVKRAEVDERECPPYEKFPEAVYGER